MGDYQPIDCSLHDRIEDLATRRQRVRITYAEGPGEVMSVYDVIADWVVREGAEYFRTVGGLRIRLDRIFGLSKK
jgi:Rho-binding antiterminator